jgi:hypothetical protein
VTEHEQLVRRFQPQLKYDSNEQYFADSAAQWTDNPANELRRADRDGRPGALIAAASPAAGAAKLTLGFLGRSAYGDGTEVQPGDAIGCRRANYREQYVALRIARPELRNRMYGRAVESRGRLWLQYWFWFFYNDYSLALGAGRHEGDWEMVQLRMHGDEPDIAVYAQHTYAGKRPWPQVERVEGRPDTPVVYVARGSHASYFEAGFHSTEAWYDLADGRRRTPVLALEIVTDPPPGFLTWRGRWGDTRPRLPGGVHQPSPTGPPAKRQWTNPGDLLDEAVVSVSRTPPPAPDVEVTRRDGLLRIDFDFSGRPEPRPRALVVTVNSRDEAGVPPRTHNLGVEETVRGTLSTTIPLDADKHYDVYVSTVTGDPPVPSASRLFEIDPVSKVAQRRDATLAGLAGRLSRVVAWVRGHLPRPPRRRSRRS